MTLRTITFDGEQWQVVPKELPEKLLCRLVPVVGGDSHQAERVAAAIADRMALQSQWRDILAAAPEPRVCFCDEKGIGDPAKSCGDCPQDYGIPTVRANPEPPAQQQGASETRLAALEAERDALRDALQWYASMSKRMGNASIAGDSQAILALMKDVAVDYGGRARAALADGEDA